MLQELLIDHGIGTFDICISLLNVYHEGIVAHRLSQRIGNHFAIHPQESAF